MSNEINYPIQYAVLELKEKSGWSERYKDVTQSFIASKCYVVESNITYHPDGSNKITHKVVFPYEDISCLKASLMTDMQDIGEGNIPSYDACNRSYPNHVVTDLFNSYEEAKIAAKEKNKKLEKDLILGVCVVNPNWEKQFEILKQEFDKRIKLCDLFEQLVLEKTKDMNISESFSDQQHSVRILKPVGKQI